MYREREMHTHIIMVRYIVVCVRVFVAIMLSAVLSFSLVRAVYVECRLLRV